jgi:hypothetical protein
MTVFGMPYSTLEWVLLLAIASSGFCMMALATMMIVRKGMTVGIDRAIYAHSVIVALLIAIAAVASWVAALAPWVI